MSALLAAQGQSSTGPTTQASTGPSSALQDLFSQIDANGDGAISKTEFENALGAGGTNLAQADDVFNKLDTNGDGSVSLGELKSALQGAGGEGGHGHHHHAHVGGGGGSGDSTGASASQHRHQRRRRERPAAAGLGGRDRYHLHQQRRFDHDLDHQSRRLQDHHDLARGNDVIEQRHRLLQFPRAADPARGAGDFIRRHPIALAQRLSPYVAGYPNRSFHAGSAPGKGSAVAL